MDDPDKAHQPSEGAPEQIAAQIAQGDLPVIIEGTGSALEAGLQAEPVAKFGFAAVAPGSAAVKVLGSWGWEEGDGVSPDAADQMVAALAEAAGELAGGIGGVPDDGNRLTPRALQQQLR